MGYGLAYGLQGLGQGMQIVGNAKADEKKQEFARKLEEQSAKAKEDRELFIYNRDQESFSGNTDIDLVGGVPTQFKLNKAGDRMGDGTPLSEYQQEQIKRADAIEKAKSEKAVFEATNAGEKIKYTQAQTGAIGQKQSLAERVADSNINNSSARTAAQVNADNQRAALYGRTPTMGGRSGGAPGAKAPPKLTDGAQKIKDANEAKTILRKAEAKYGPAKGKIFALDYLRDKGRHDLAELLEAGE